MYPTSRFIAFAMLRVLHPAIRGMFTANGERGTRARGSPEESGSEPSDASDGTVWFHLASGPRYKGRRQRMGIERSEYGDRCRRMRRSRPMHRTVQYDLGRSLNCWTRRSSSDLALRRRSVARATNHVAPRTFSASPFQFCSCDLDVLRLSMRSPTACLATSFWHRHDWKW